MGTRLTTSASPYLRAHADNPVDWYPWGEAAFAAARERDVPVLVSIGYATCHWCHVMARESFSDPGVAELLNGGFVSIKVDREEHPDVDSSYLAAASAFTRELGLAADGVRHARWPGVLRRDLLPATPAARRPVVRAGARGRRRSVARSPRATRHHRRRGRRRIAGGGGASRPPGRCRRHPSCNGPSQRLATDEDRVHGGFGGAPKFPVAPVLGFLAASGESGRTLARRTLEHMAASPLRDPVDGGFFRYATRADWSEPHYERMLTDNAQLLRIAVDLAVTESDAPSAPALVNGIAGFLAERLRLPDGAFASAQDSESIIDGARNEGGYYQRDAAGRAGLEPPALDQKVLTGWNGLAIGALARAAFVFDEPRMLDLARQAAETLLEHHVDGDRLVHASLGGIPSTAVATLEDSGMLAGGLLELAVATGEVRYAVVARRLIDAALEAGAATGDDEHHVADTVFAAPGGSDPVLVARGIAVRGDPAEGATPSGVTACADAAWRLYLLGAGERYRDAAEDSMRSIAGIAVERPIAFGGALELMSRLAAPVVQLVTVLPDAFGNAEDPDAAGGTALTEATRRHAASVSVILQESQARAFADAGFELFAGRTAPDARPAAYRCDSFVCALPVTDAVALDALASTR